MYRCSGCNRSVAAGRTPGVWRRSSRPVQPPTTFEETVERLGTAIRLGAAAAPGPGWPPERELAEQLRHLALDAAPGVHRADPERPPGRRSAGASAGTFVADHSAAGPKGIRRGHSSRARWARAARLPRGRGDRGGAAGRGAREPTPISIPPPRSPFAEMEDRRRLPGLPPGRRLLPPRCWRRPPYAPRLVARDDRGAGPA